MSLATLQKARAELKEPSKKIRFGRLLGSIAMDAADIAETLVLGAEATATIGAIAAAGTAGAAAGAGTGAATGATIAGVVSAPVAEAGGAAPAAGAAIVGFIGTIIGFFGGAGTALIAGTTAMATTLAASVVGESPVDAIFLWSERHIDKHKKEIQAFHELMLKERAVAEQDLAAAEQASAQAEADLQKAQQQRGDYRQFSQQPGRPKYGKLRARQFRMRLSKFSKNKLVVKFGFTKNIFQVLQDKVPLLEVWPWRSIGLWWWYPGIIPRDRAYLKLYRDVIAEYNETVMVLQQMKAEELRFMQEALQDEEEAALTMDMAAGA